MRRKAICLIGIPILFILMATAVFCGLSYRATADASSVLTVEQTEKVEYCGKNFITADGQFSSFGGETEVKNPLFDALTFTLDGEKVTVARDSVTFENVAEIRLPDTYSRVITVNIGGENYTATANLTVSKKKLYVSTKINGESYCEVNEGEAYRTSVVYDGFVEGDDVNSLDAPAIIQREPKLPTTGFLLVPELAQSSVYEFVYVGATIVINPNPDTERTYENGGETALILRGSFSPYYTLEFFDVGINKANPKYAAINEKIEKYFGNNRVFEEYEQTDAYVINMYLDGEYAEITDQINVRIKVPSKYADKKYYRIIHFGNDGSYEFINASYSDGYVSFTTTDLGEFVLLTPIEGANTVVIVAICVSIVGVAALAVLLFAIFRRKY